MIRSKPTIVALVGLALVAIGLVSFAAAVSAAGSGAAGQAAPTPDQAAMDSDELALGAYNDGTYSVVQGDRCVPIEPLGDGYQTAEEYYDYRHPDTSPSSYTYSSHGTTHLQESDTSRILLHDGGNGLNLVVVHGRLEGLGDGGRATFVFDGLPEDGEWAVKDDQYDLGNGSQSDDVWDSRDNASRVSWVWTDGRTDGGAYTGLGDDFEITVRPAFNDVADLQLTDGEVEDWQVVSGDDRNPQATSLDMTESIVIRSGGCTAVTDLAIEERTGGDVTINATVINEGDVEETVTVPIALDGEVVEEREVTVGANDAVSFNTSVRLNGASEVSVGSRTATVDSDGGFADGLPGFGVPVAVAAILSVLALRIRR